MPSRRVKTLRKNPKERNHREHRAKSGRRNYHGVYFSRDRKIKLDKISKEEHYEEMFQNLNR